MEILSTSYINNLVDSYISAQTKQRLQPIQNNKNKFSSLSTTLGSVNTKVTSLLSSLTTLKSTSSSSIFNSKSATSSNENFITSTVDKTASIGAYDFHVSQLAKNDMAISKEVDSTTVFGLSGTHSFTINSGDDSSTDLTSNISVDFDGTETNQEAIEKIRDAINGDTVSVSSNEKSAASAYSGGASTIKFDIGGTEYSVSAEGGSTYEALIDELVQNINSGVDGVTAEKILDDPASGDVKLKLSVNNNSDYISITHESGFDLVSDLGISKTKEISSAGIITASSFTPSSGKTQFSITSKNSGLDFRITNLSDDSGSTVLNQLGLNLGASRTAFDQGTDPDTAGFIYSDITDANNLLNSKFTFNGLSIQKNSNSVDDLVTGVTFNLKSVMEAGDSNVNVTVDTDTSAIKSEVESFITKFNDLYSYLKTQTKSVDGNRGVLIGESTSQTLLNTMRSIGYNSYGTEGDEFQYLSQIGISFDTDSGLSISNSSLFEEKLAQAPDDVELLFNGDNGIANVFYANLDLYTGSTGYISLAKENYDDSVVYLSDRMDRVGKSIENSAEILRDRYVQMQNQLAILLSSQSFFSNYQ